jgi:hypothetical protein
LKALGDRLASGYTADDELEAIADDWSTEYVSFTLVNNTDIRDVRRRYLLSPRYANAVEWGPNRSRDDRQQTLTLPS